MEVQDSLIIEPNEQVSKEESLEELDIQGEEDSKVVNIADATIHQPIAWRKRQCIKWAPTYPIENYMSDTKLLGIFKALTTNSADEQILRSIHEALKN